MRLFKFDLNNKVMLKSAFLNEYQGLSYLQAQERLRAEGFNEIPSEKQKNLFIILKNTIMEPMFLLLIACGSLYLILGDTSEALMLLGFVFVIILITFYQERKTERALDALRNLSSPRALVIRDGREIRISGREVVREDILVLSEGDRVAADASLIYSNNLTIDESLLTGESVPVRKIESEDPINCEFKTIGGDDQPFVYSGTLVVRGKGLAFVRATGIKTQMGKIGRLMQDIKQEKTQLEKETKNIVKITAISGLILCLFVIILYGLSRNNWINGILTGITLAMALLPEEFPVVMTIFLALGAWRMSKKHVLTRKPQAIQELGSVTVLCSDKTGTITENKMTVKKIFDSNTFHNTDKGEDLSFVYEILKFSVLACQEKSFDPMEKAIVSLFTKNFTMENMTFIKEYPLSRNLLAMTNVWMNESRDLVIASKGAPEAILNLCRFSPEKYDEIMQKVHILAQEGYRILAVAKSSFSGKNLPNISQDFNYEFLGLLGFEDPIRTQVPKAIKEAHDAGIKVIMITGDYSETARNIGKQIGLANLDNIITGPELDEMSDEELREKSKDVAIFARVIPEQKLRIVNAFKDNKEIVAMTGDGVNDSPALKSANIGIAMGMRGTDVAREASSVVLLDDDFSSIVHGISMGRRIFDNIRKAMAYILAVHIPIAGLTILSVLLNWPLILYPVHVVFMELIIDPACSIVFEAQKEEANIMTRPPRHPNERIFNKLTVIVSIIQGFIVFILVAFVFRYYIDLGLTQGMSMQMAEDEARAFAFGVLIVGNLSLIITNIYWTRNIIQIFKEKNPTLIVLSIFTILFLLLVLIVPFLQELFMFRSIHPQDYVLMIASVILLLITFEILKKIIRIEFYQASTVKM